jgi:hypothetical protein
MKAFYISGGLSHIYGKRVFLNKEYIWEMLKGTHCFLDQLPHEPKHPVVKVLRENCCWGGPDKIYDDWYGYEVTCVPEKGEQALNNIVKVLQEQGLTQLDECPWR